MARSRAGGAFLGAVSEGRTPLHNAKSPAVIEVLLQAGADVATRDADGRTPLHHAAALCGGPLRQPPSGVGPPRPLLPRVSGLFPTRWLRRRPTSYHGPHNRCHSCAVGGRERSECARRTGFDCPSCGCNGGNGRIEQPGFAIRNYRRRPDSAGCWSRCECAERRWRNTLRSCGRGVRCLLAAERRTLQRAASGAVTLRQIAGPPASHPTVQDRVSVDGGRLESRHAARARQDRRSLRSSPAALQTPDSVVTHT